jgi:UTP:GlnB (protein PII) uridylyltransferase
LLYRLASTFTDAGVDVRVAKVVTLGTRVVDVFYVDRVEDAESLRAALTRGITG